MQQKIWLGSREHKAWDILSAGGESWDAEGGEEDKHYQIRDSGKQGKGGRLWERLAV